MANKKNSFVAMDRAKLDTLIKSIASRGKKLDNDIHKAGLNVIFHIDKHGDITGAEKLINAMPKSSRRKALIVWLIDHSKLDYDETEKCYIYKRNKTTKLEKAIETPFWEYTPEIKPVSPIDLDKRLKTLIENAEKALADEVASKKSNIDMDKLAKLKELVG